MANHTLQQKNYHQHASQPRRPKNEPNVYRSRNDREGRPPSGIHDSASDAHPELAIRSWLLRLDDEDTKLQRTSAGESSLSTSIEPGHPAKGLSSYQKSTNICPQATEQGHRHHERFLSDDSSVIMPAVSRSPIYKAQRSLPESQQMHTRSPGPASRRSSKRKRGSSPVSARAQIHLTGGLKPEEEYAKRKRHKTKLDRYEAKPKAVTESRRSRVRTERPEKAKTSQLKKTTRRIGEDLLRNFASSKIANDRLTIRPGTGIFKNGKASSPTKKHGMPDLAFSEMQFLKTSKRHNANHDSEVTLSKHQQRKQQEREKSRQEISDYFAKQPRSPRPASPLGSRITVTPEVSHSRMLTKNTKSASFEDSQSSHRFPVRSECSQNGGEEAVLSEVLSEASRRENSAATSYVSWSVTTRSQNDLKSDDASNHHLASDDVSSRASQVRRRLLESGVLDEWIVDTRQPEKPKRRSRCARSLSDYSAQTSLPSEMENARFVAYQRHKHDAQLRPHVLGTVRYGETKITTPKQAAHIIKHEVVKSNGTPRKCLAKAAYLPRPVSTIPRRPATTLPLCYHSASGIIEASRDQRTQVNKLDSNSLPLFRDSCFGGDSWPEEVENSRFEQEPENISSVSYGGRYSDEDSVMLNDVLEGDPIPPPDATADCRDGWEEQEVPYREQFVRNDAYSGQLDNYQAISDRGEETITVSEHFEGYLDSYLQIPRGRSFFQEIAATTEGRQDESDLIPQECLRDFWT